MKLATGKVISGHVVIDGPEPLQEGARVTVLVPSDGGGFELSSEDEAELLRALEAAEAEPSITGDELLRRLG